MGKINLMDFPDDLLCSQILTRLPLKEAVRFSGVSRKGCRGWTQLPHLKFCDEFFDSICTNPTNGNAISKLTRQNMAADIINKIFLMQCVGLETFQLDNCEWFESSIHEWLLWISLLGVKSVDLKCSGFQSKVSESIFSCVTLTSLSLKDFKMVKVPPLFQGFCQLETLYLEQVELSEEAFEVILKLCRLLQGLTVSECRLPSNLRVVSSSLKFFALLPRRMYNGSMEANCPKLESIKIESSSLDIVNLCLPVCVHLETNFLLLQAFATLKSLKNITCFGDPSFCCPKDLAELTLQLVNLKTFAVNIGSYDYAKHYETYVVAFMFYSCVLESSPMLETVILCMDYRSERFGRNGFDGALQIVNDFRILGRGFPKIKISVSRRLVSPGGR